MRLLQVFLVFFYLSPHATSAQDSLSLIKSQDTLASFWDSQSHYSYSQILIKFDDTYTKQIPLTLIILNDSGWSESAVLEKLKRTQEIYSQCKISFSPVIIVKTHSFYGPTINRDFPATVLMNSSMQVVFKKPVVYFVANEVLGRSNAGYSWRASSKGGLSNPSKKNSIILFSSQALLPEKSSSLKDTQPGHYEVLAHEIAHLLLNSSHKKGSHIMGGMGIRSNIIEPGQCAKIQEFSP